MREKRVILCSPRFENISHLFTTKFTKVLNKKVERNIENSKVLLFKKVKLLFIPEHVIVY